MTSMEGDIMMRVRKRVRFIIILTFRVSLSITVTYCIISITIF